MYYGRFHYMHDTAKASAALSLFPWQPGNRSAEVITGEVGGVGGGAHLYAPEDSTVAIETCQDALSALAN